MKVASHAMQFESMLFPLTYGYIKCHSYKVFLQNDQKLLFFVFKSLYWAITGLSADGCY